MWGWEPVTQPDDFPRRDWFGTIFGMPPYEEGGDHAYQVNWAAREASRSWARALEKAYPDCEYLQSKAESRSKPEFGPGSGPAYEDVVDKTCFQLALYDALYEE